MITKSLLVFFFVSNECIMMKHVFFTIGGFEKKKKKLRKICWAMRGELQEKRVYDEFF